MTSEEWADFIENLTGTPEEKIAAMVAKGADERDARKIIGWETGEFRGDLNPSQPETLENDPEG